MDDLETHNGTVEAQRRYYKAKLQEFRSVIKPNHHRQDVLSQPKIQRSFGS